MKEKFSATEWEALEQLPYFVFFSVAAADNEISDAEVEVFLHELSDAVHYREPLVRELFFDLATGDQVRLLPEIRAELNDPAIPLADMADKRKKILRAHLSNEEYHRFIYSLIGFGKTIGDASGGATDDTEWGRLALFGQLFELDMQVGKAGMDALPGAPAVAAAPTPGSAGHTEKKRHWWSHQS